MKSQQIQTYKTIEKAINAEKYGGGRKDSFSMSE